MILKTMGGKYFFYPGLSSQALTFHRTGDEEWGSALLLSTTPTRLRRSRHLYAILHIR